MKSDVFLQAGPQCDCDLCPDKWDSCTSKGCLLERKKNDRPKVTCWPYDVPMKGAQQEAVDLVQSHINTLERRIEGAKNALENGNQTWLALDILNGKRGY